MYISDIGQKRWIQQRLEGSRSCQLRSGQATRNSAAPHCSGNAGAISAHQICRAKRFSLEGGETLIPLLDHLLRRASGQGVEETVIGMAHRGRLNVLVNILGKMPSMLFAEFEGKHAEHLTSGDVKYHNGFSSEVVLPQGSMHVTLAFNPSHLEIVSPVVEGSVRARQHTRGDHDGSKVMPVILHGDSAFTGQGVVMETFNLSQTRGYSTGGSVHIIINNQIGFTTSDVRDIRSSTYCTDVAKMVEAPIFHVNADDPEAVLLVTEIALDYRMAFSRDVVIDLVCFRKLGHNEQDEPLVTQPFMYRYINKHPGMRALYAKRLVDAGVIAADEPEAMIAAYRKAMDEGRSPVETVSINAKRSHAKRWSKYSLDARWDVTAKTAVPRERLQFLAERLTTVPENFKLHSRVEKIMEDRLAMGKGELALDWGMAENLAYASLLTEGYPVRLSGQDCGRGTFFHRHAVLHDQNRTVWHEVVHAFEKYSGKSGGCGGDRLNPVGRSGAGL
jgi:2-oxoglutarate dehydrogenase E1 component